MTVATVPKTQIPIIFGTMTFGAPGKGGARVTSLGQCQDILNAFFARGHIELDTARVYAGGTTEEYLAQLRLGRATIDTKVAPSKAGDHRAPNLRRIFQSSLDILGEHNKVRVLYLHAPDRSVPFEETCAEIDQMYQDGLFEIFGLSNYAAWEVAEIVGICDRFGYVRPKIYQGMYNAITRAMEAELVPCLRHFNIRLVIYNPLAGGLVSGKILSADDSVEKGSRFDATAQQGRDYRKRYFRPAYFDAIKNIKAVADKSNLTMTEIALRWCQHHSVLLPSDGIIIGASNLQHLKDNLSDSEKGPLPQIVLDVLNEAWASIGSDCPPYFR
ncbi:hypothetical protein FRB94_007620 [Tulasnella sp. JGI-2019a]|nr:hypothetical protein FRB93_007342 [Tulasnella sp. JGI-2019a]KAG8997527.1 hypothetical protein FRB94_007620 [Tulasnella sp. JGI-2019a]KAG9030099.1 hypothetical protein FRB95_004339 [Tulasnella sp. JGI-2019a]